MVLVSPTLEMFINVHRVMSLPKEGIEGREGNNFLLATLCLFFVLSVACPAHLTCSFWTAFSMQGNSEAFSYCASSVLGNGFES